MEIITTNLFDDDGNSYPAMVEIQFEPNGEITVIHVEYTAKRILNNPQDDIVDAIRRKYKNAQINFTSLEDPVNSIWLPRPVSQSNGTKTRSLNVGEDFTLTCIGIEESNGQKYIVTEIGILNVK